MVSKHHTVRKGQTGNQQTIKSQPENRTSSYKPIPKDNPQQPGWKHGKNKSISVYIRVKYKEPYVRTCAPKHTAKPTELLHNGQRTSSNI